MVDRDGIAFQHRRLETFVEEIVQALEREDRRQSETAAFRLQGAVHAHFDVETQVIFPSVRARHPALRKELDDLEREHGRLRQKLESLCMSVFASDAATVRNVLTDFRRALKRHEQLEEELLDRAETRGPPAGFLPPVKARRPETAS